jgi:uncharacterized protein YkwD
MSPCVRPLFLPLLAAWVLLAAAVGACAGDAAPPAAAGVAVSPAAPGTCGLARFEADVLREVNAFRAQPRSCGARGRFAAAEPLRWSGALTRLASAHARDMAARNAITHDDARGRGPAQRATAAGYGWRVFAENVAGHHAGVVEVVRGWQNSAGHCANLMNPEVSELGVACAPGGPRSEYQAYWAMELASPR